MGSFRSLRESLILMILYSLVMCNEVICTNLEEPVLSESTISIKMPGTSPLEKDTYLCTAVQLAPQKQYIVEFEPSASQKTAHHMLLYGCGLPGAPLPSWNCKRGPYMECKGVQKTLYAWAKDAPAKYLPKDVGFAVGGDSGIRYLVLEVHYAHVDTFQAGAKDYSGFILHTRQHSLPYGGGIYLLWAYSGSIPPETSGIHVDMACKYNKPETMFAFAFRTHAHTLAKVITGYRIRDDIWTLLGKGDPQAPQAFYPMERTFEIKKGDILAARCTYDSRGHNIHGVVHMGATGHDEMCNFYIMYYSNAERLQYSGGDCGNQNHPEVFRDFPSDSDMPLVHVHPLDSKATSDQPTSHITATATVHTTSSYVVMPTKDVKKSTQMTVPLEVSTESTSRDEASHEMDISDLQYGEEESPLTSSSSKQDKDVTTEAISQGVSKETDESSSKVFQPVIPALTVTSTPVRPVTQSSDSDELHIVSGWPSLTEMETSKLGQVTGVSMDSKGQVVVFHRGSRIWDDNTFDSSNAFRNADTVGTIKEHTVWILDAVTGKAKGFWGKNMFYLPHGLTIDHEDNLWLTDVGSHQVFKFSSLGSRTQRLLALGDKLVPGSGDSRFCKPTSVAVDRSGEFFVADGYCNSRILKFSAAGKLLSSWGKQSYSGPGVPAPPGSFLIPHSLALDQSNHKLYVADRENGRVQSFNSTSGAFVDEIKLPEFGGVVFAVDYSDSKQGGVLHVVNGQNRDQDKYVPIQGFTIRIADKVILQKWPSEEEQVLSQPHDLVSSVDGSDVFVVEIGPNRIWKLSSKPQTDSFITGAVTIPTNTVPVLTSDKLTSQVSHSIDGSDPNSQQDGNEKKGPIIQSSQKASAAEGSDDRNLAHFGNKTEKGPIYTSSHHASTGPDRHSGDGKESPTSTSDDLASTHRGKVNDTRILEPSPQGSVLRANATGQSHGQNSSLSGPRDEALDSDNSDNSGNITAGVIPALIILSVLAVPIVFLLLISITLRLRAYHRDKRSHMNGFPGSKKNLTVGRTRGWMSYMNCCDRQKYKFNRVTLQDFYSDSDSDGV